MQFRLASQPWDAPNWNRLIASFPGAHILQSWQWGEVKSQFGWRPLYCTWEDSGEVSIRAAALVLERSAALPLLGRRLRLLYAPRGPLLLWEDQAARQRVLEDLASLARSRRALFIKIDPEVSLGSGLPGAVDAVDDPLGQALIEDLRSGGWRFSEEQVQFCNTVMIDLSPSVDELLANMKQKARYNIRLAQRKGVSVRRGGVSDIDLLYRMYAETAARDDFVIRDASYYRALWTVMFTAGFAEALIAEVQGEAIAALVLFHFGAKAWYMQGMSRPLHREKMPNHLLQWEAIQRAKELGCTVYDLWGAPDTFDESDPLWGVYRFKEGLGGRVIRTVGAWDFPSWPLGYRLYTQILPRILDRMRRRGKQRTRQMVA
jgi:lipid II:glycine glycyltransferase (peptidoglycan interpeptide bridge formation enzyme)